MPKHLFLFLSEQEEKNKPVTDNLFQLISSA